MSAEGEGGWMGGLNIRQFPTSIGSVKYTPGEILIFFFYRAPDQKQFNPIIYYLYRRGNKKEGGWGV